MLVVYAIIGVFAFGLVFALILKAAFGAPKPPTYAETEVKSRINKVRFPS